MKINKLLSGYAMNKKIILLCLVSAIFPPLSNADTIFKCNDAGRVSYVNGADKKGHCVATDLADTSKMAIVKNNNKKISDDVILRSQLLANNQSKSNNNSAANREQALRNARKLNDLKSELEQEKEKQKSIVSMLKSAKGDKGQTEKLTVMKNESLESITRLNQEISQLNKAKKQTNKDNNQAIDVSDLPSYYFGLNEDMLLNKLNTNPDSLPPLILPD